MSISITIHLRMRRTIIYILFVKSHINGKQEFIMRINMCQKVANYSRMTTVVDER